MIVKYLRPWQESDGDSPPPLMMKKYNPDTKKFDVLTSGPRFDALVKELYLDEISMKEVMAEVECTS